MRRKESNGRLLKSNKTWERELAFILEKTNLLLSDDSDYTMETPINLHSISFVQKKISGFTDFE